MLPLLIATYNLHFASRLDRALAILASEPRLAAADVLAVQEADEDATNRIAERLGLHAVYHPALRHPRTGRNFGPALLSRWPVVAERRIALPHHGVHRMPRIAVAATLEIRGHPVTAYAVHFGTMREILPSHQAAQARVVLAEARATPGPAIIAGDLNRRGLGRLIAEAGWHWLTRDIGRTHLIWSFDHLFVRDVNPATTAAGTVAAALEASDHRAVWAALSP